MLEKKNSVGWKIYIFQNGFVITKITFQNFDPCSVKADYIFVGSSGDGVRR